MQKTDFQARRLNIPAFCAAEAALSGQLLLSELSRVAVDAASDAVAPLDTPFGARWHAQGSQSAVTGTRRVHDVMALTVSARIPLVCQRCLTPVTLEVDAERRFLFADDEDVAAQLDEELDDMDVLATDKALDLPALIEDEILLALPAVPLHAECPPEASAFLDALRLDGEEGAAPPQQHPFAGLAALKKGA
jgi:uncharacterized protein